jgi:hypothetical protein
MSPSPKFYDSEGKEVKQAFYDIDGNLIEESKAAPVGVAKTKTDIRNLAKTLPPAKGDPGPESLPIIGSTFGPLGTFAGALAKQVIAPSQNGAGAAVDVGKEMALNSLLPWGVTKAATGIANVVKAPAVWAASKLSNFPAVRERAVQSITNQFMGGMRPESQVMAEGAETAAQRFGQMTDEARILQEAAPKLAIPPKPIPLKSQSKSFQASQQKAYDEAVGQVKGGDIWGPEVEASMQGIESLFGKGTAGNMLVELQKAGGDFSKSPTFKQISTTVLGDLKAVQNAKMAAGPRFTNEVAMQDLIGANYKGSSNSINAKAVLDKLDGTKGEIYREALGPEVNLRLRQTMSELMKMEEKGLVDRIIRYSGNKLVWNLSALGMGGLGHALGGGVGGTLGIAAVEGPVITNWALNKLMNNPETAALVLQALKTPKTAQEAPVIAKAIATAIQGVTVGAAAQK